VFVNNNETKCCQLPGCPKPVAVNRRGRPARFCSPAHKLRAFRARNTRDDVTFERTSFPKHLKKEESDKPKPLSCGTNKTEREHTSLDFDATPVPSFDFPSRLSLSFDHTVRRGVRA
jgi:hypothetical protein